jgi:hypothetical protein
MAVGKFKALVHYIVDACDPHRLGATRLNKICWYVDTCTYRLSGQSMTGETYVKRKHGPVPKTILKTIRELEQEGKIHVREHAILPTRKMRLFVSLKDPNKSFFDPQELEMIDLIAKQICEDHSAASISELSHDAIWDAANDGEEIPMYAPLVAEPAELSAEVTAWARRVVKQAAGNRDAA